MFLAALFTKSETWKWPKCPLTDEWVKMIWYTYTMEWTSLVAQMVESACSTGDLGSVLGSGRSPAEGNGNALQYSCQENPMERRAWWATVHGVAKGRSQPSNFHSYSGIFLSPQKEWNNVICSSMDRPNHYHTQSVRKRKPYTIWHHLHVESKTWHKWTYLWNGNRVTAIENGTVVAKGERVGRKMNWECGD